MLKKRVVLQIDPSDGKLFVSSNPANPQNHRGVSGRDEANRTDLNDETDPDSPPDGATLKGSWYWAANSPGCVYVFHHGYWIKVCD